MLEQIPAQFDVSFSDVITIVGAMIMILGSFYATQNDIKLVRNDMDNHKANHKRLEERVLSHEDKIENKLAGLDRKIDDKHNILNDKLDELKDLLIERTK